MTGRKFFFVSDLIIEALSLSTYRSSDLTNSNEDLTISLVYKHFDLFQVQFESLSFFVSKDFVDILNIKDISSISTKSDILEMGTKISMVDLENKLTKESNTPMESFGVIKSIKDFILYDEGENMRLTLSSFPLYLTGSNNFFYDKFLFFKTSTRYNKTFNKALLYVEVQRVIGAKLFHNAENPEAKETLKDRYAKLTLTFSEKEYLVLATAKSIAARTETPFPVELSSVLEDLKKHLIKFNQIVTPASII